jgi:exopolysaccharide biosynthesis polyprenyl glycosylphosphotransferase
MLLRVALYQLRNRGYNTRNLLLVSSGSKSDVFIRLIEQHAAWGFRIIGIMGATSAITEYGKHYPYYGEIDDVITVCKQEMIDEVVFCLPRSESEPIDFLVHDLNELGITTRMVLDLMDFPANRSELTIFHDELPMLTFYSKAFDARQLLAKRIVDILGACVGLVMFWIMLPLLALLIRRDSPGPIFFCQERVGENGRRFRCWKLRTMYVDAEQRKQELMAQNEMSGAMFKIKDDPRITPLGRFLRKTSLDEFPQFWNVMRGEMSLVGTRPPTPDEVVQYENWHRKRICIKPGLTGLWQVSGRSKIQDFDEVARLDIRYIEDWSIWLDLKIIAKTVWVVTAGRGAS